MNRRDFLAATALSTAALLTTGQPTSAAARTRTTGPVTPLLPAPTGPYRVGATALHLVDRTRRDPLEPGIPVRELMLTVHHPARATTGHPPAPYMTARAATSFAEFQPAAHPGLPAAGVDWAGPRTHAYAGAPVLPGRWPVLLYSPGGGDPRTLGTALAEDLASHGHVVVTVDHPGDACGVEFPRPAPPYRTGVLRESVLRGDPRTDPALFRTLIDARVADLRFVLGRLEDWAAGHGTDADGRPLPAGLGRTLDLRRTAAYGHSAGGTAVAQALHEDHRLRAAVNLEGFLDHPTGELFPVARDGADRPLLLLGTDGFAGRTERDRSWQAACRRSRGHAVRHELTGTAHWVFTDHAAFAPRLQAAGLMTAESRAALVGPRDPATTVPLVRGLVRAFLARHLAAPQRPRATTAPGV
ncbi:lipase [Streptomyces mashuensis]|uniref:Lipase n=1 Tax=Streptomyces mashuensis TaxID=33904 RepID=A0A919AZ95_9ACTN|nr:alpha/beta hydrolase [Streptomyces mashuensis]GHF29868.1 lipase [Streptomyces mashuensis]